MKQRYLLPLLLLAPLLAHADALSAYGLGKAVEFYLGIFLAITVGGFLFVSWRRPQGRRLYVGAVLVFCVAVLCYLNGPQLSSVAVVLCTVVVLGLLLGSQARSAALRKAVSLAVKVAGLSLVVVLLLLLD